MNSITESASIDQCVDEILGTEVLHRVVRKPGINKGGQAVMLFDAGLGCRGRNGNQEHNGSDTTN
eukprot:2515367-Ditylum_brightwellii.AAC.1